MKNTHVNRPLNANFTSPNRTILVLAIFGRACSNFDNFSQYSSMVSNPMFLSGAVMEINKEMITTI